MYRPSLSPGNIPGIHFCYSLSLCHEQSAAGMFMSMKNCNDTIGNRNRHLPICNPVSQPTAPPSTTLLIFTYLLTYLLTPWCRVLLEKLNGLQLVKKFPAFHGTRRFITALTSVRQLSLSWASPIQSIYPHPTSWIFSLILPTHLRLGLPSGLLPSGFPTKTLYIPLSSPIRATCPAHLI